MPWSNPGPARRVIIAGSQGQILIYQNAVGPNNLIGSWSGAAGVDAVGNAYPQGFSLVNGALGKIQWALENGGVDYGAIEAVNNLVGGDQELQILGPALAAFIKLTSTGAISLDSSGGVGVIGSAGLTVSGGSTIADNGFQIGGGVNNPLGDVFHSAIIDSFSVNFAGVVGVNGTRQYKGGAYSFAPGISPIILPMLIVGANNDIAFDAQGVPTNTSFAYRFFQTRGVAATTTITVTYLAIG